MTEGAARPRRLKPRIRHAETHFEGSEVVRDAVLGMSDGLTVPFALAAGLSGAAAGARVILIAGAAELAAGAIAMGLGGYLAAKSEADTWRSERRREEREIKDIPEEEVEEVRRILRSWGLTGETLESATRTICSDEERWVAFMMREELELTEPDPRRALLVMTELQRETVALVPPGPNVERARLWLAQVAAVLAGA